MKTPTLSRIITTILFLILTIIIPQRALATSKRYVASRNSEVYHIVECGHASRIDSSNRIYFSTREEAEATGRRPCSYCYDGIVSEGRSKTNKTEATKPISKNNPSSGQTNTETKKQPSEQETTIRGIILSKNFPLWLYLGLTVAVTPFICVAAIKERPNGQKPGCLAVTAVYIFPLSMVGIMILAGVFNIVEKISFKKRK